MDKQDYDKAIKECWNKFCESHPYLSKSLVAQKAFQIIFDHIHHNLTSDAEGEEMLTVSRKNVQRMYSYNEEELTKDPTNKGALLLKLRLDALFGSKCLPDEVGNEDNFSTEEPKPAEMTEERYQHLNSLSLEDYDNETSADEQRQFCEYQHKHHPDEVEWLQTHSDDNEPEPSIPKFKHKLGDKVRIVNDWSHGYKHNGEVTEIVAIDESDPEVPYKVDIYDEEECGGLWYSQSDLEPYTGPKDEHKSDNTAQKSANVNSNAQTCMDDCPSQGQYPNPMEMIDHIVQDHEMVDNIIKDGFKNHNRLNIAAMAMQGILSNIDLFKNVLETGMETLGGDGISFRAVAKSSFLFADALINEAEEGGSK